MKNEHLKKTSHIEKISDLMQEYRKSHTDLTPIKKHSGAKLQGIYICGKILFHPECGQAFTIFTRYKQARFTIMEGGKVMDYIRTRHSVYLLTYHMVFVTKWRKPAISDEIGDFMVRTARRLCEGYGGELVQGETDRDYIHLLVSLPPKACVGNVGRSLKTQLSREVHTHPEYDAYVKQYIYGDTPLWSPSYFVASTGAVSLEYVKAYIAEQRTEEHKQI